MSNTLSINLGVLHLPMAKMYLKLHVTFNLTDAKVSVSIYKQICLSLSLCVSLYRVCQVRAVPTFTSCENLFALFALPNHLAKNFWLAIYQLPRFPSQPLSTCPLPYTFVSYKGGNANRAQLYFSFVTRLRTWQSSK